MFFCNNLNVYLTLVHITLNPNFCVNWVFFCVFLWYALIEIALMFLFAIDSSCDPPPPVLLISVVVPISCLMPLSQPLHSSCSSMLLSPFLLYTFAPSSFSPLFLFELLKLMPIFFSSFLFQGQLWKLQCCLVPSCVRPGSHILSLFPSLFS